jgi:hypothetical protein
MITTTKDLLTHLGSTMEKLNQRTISVEEAKAQASLVKQSNNLLRYELDVEKFKYKTVVEKINPE